MSNCSCKHNSVFHEGGRGKCLKCNLCVKFTPPMFDDRSEKVCLCSCHRDLLIGYFLEFMSCCNITNQKYIFWNGEVDHSRLAAHLKRAQSLKDETKP